MSSFPSYLSEEDMNLFLKECKLAGYDVAVGQEWGDIYVGEGRRRESFLKDGWFICYWRSPEDGMWFVAYASVEAPDDVTVNGMVRSDLG